MEICGNHIFPLVSDLHLCNLCSVFLAPRNDSVRSALIASIRARGQVTWHSSQASNSSTTTSRQSSHRILVSLFKLVPELVLRRTASLPTSLLVVYYHTILNSSRFPGQYHTRRLLERSLHLLHFPVFELHPVITLLRCTDTTTILYVDLTVTQAHHGIVSASDVVHPFLFLLNNERIV